MKCLQEINPMASEEHSSNLSSTSSSQPETIGSESDPYTKDTPLNLDEELEFSSAHMTRSAFTAKIIFITIITVILFTLFVAVFYFVFTAKVEKRVVQSSINKTVESMFGDMKIVLTASQLKHLSQLLSSLTLPDLKKQDQEARAHNTSLMKKSFFYLGIGAVALLVVLFVYYFVMRHKARKIYGAEAVRGVHYPAMGSVVFVSAMGFVGVVIAEFVFLYLIAARYQPLDSYTVRRNIIEALIDFPYCQNKVCPPPNTFCKVQISKGPDNRPVLTPTCVLPPLPKANP